MRLGPLKFKADLRERIWGTLDLRPVFTDLPKRRIGEAWCLHDGSRVADGPLQGCSACELVERFGERILGRPRTGAAADGDSDRPSTELPVVGKILFIEDRLSIQVHPDDQRASALPTGRGKTELWYVIEASSEARLGLGLDRDLSADALRSASAGGDIVSSLRWLPARPGDCILLPAGTVHSARGRLLLCEIQQNSDITYRLHDYGRPGLDGRPRALQVSRAVEASNVGSRPEVARPKPSDPPLSFAEMGTCRIGRLGQCPHFTAEVLTWNAPFLYTPNPRHCDVLICIAGHGSMDLTPFGPGDAFLVPAEAGRFPVIGEDAVLIRAYVPTPGWELLRRNRRRDRTHTVAGPNRAQPNQSAAIRPGTPRSSIWPIQ